ncbi:MAG: DUF3048 domain-containing protein [Chloroflexi bacterium]|nr:DUF3048 domain-containing protein [Chloroflexota bacterium]
MRGVAGERRVLLISVVGLIVVLVAAAGGLNLAASAPRASATPTSATASATEQEKLVAEAEQATPTPTATATALPSPTPTPSATPTPVWEQTFDFQPMAVMIDNQQDARPQTGMSDADVVYEAVVEAGITRFMAIFANRAAPVVGPIRSARHYFIYWAGEYNAIYVHAGSSPQGYAAERSTGISRIDFTYGEGSFWRSADRAAPHNLYASIERLRQTIRDRGEGSLGPLVFKPDAPDPGITEITIVHPDGYRVGYTYDAEDNSYLRYMLGRPHVDAANGAQYRAKNVVVQLVRTWRIPGDNAGRMDMALVDSSGPAYFFLDGKAIEGSWRKDSPTSPTQLLDEHGQRVLFNAGQTWIQIVPSSGKVTYE